jgi:hypothetical protein
MQQTIPPANKFASGLAPDPQRWAVKTMKWQLKAAWDNSKQRGRSGPINKMSGLFI